MLTPQGRFITLVKPQFEADASLVGEGGIVRDPRVHHEVLARAIRLFSSYGLYPVDVCPSPITGAKGNREFFLFGDRALFGQASSDALAERVAELIGKAELL